MPTRADQQSGADEANAKGSSSPDPYLEHLPDDDREAYRAASPTVDLSAEIRLLRTVLSRLARGLPTTCRSMILVVGMLVRAVSLQAKHLGGTSDSDQNLRDAAELVLRNKEDSGDAGDSGTTADSGDAGDSGTTADSGNTEDSP